MVYDVEVALWIAVMYGRLSDDIEVSDAFEPNNVIYIIFTHCPAPMEQSGQAIQNFFIMSPLDHAGRWFSGTVP